jgi:hypothetical protein
MLLMTAGSVSAATPSTQTAAASTGQFDPKAWAAVKAALDASKLTKSVSVVGGVRTTKYTLADGSALALTEPAGSAHGVSPMLSIGGCGFLRLCVWLNRGDQLIVAAGSFAALTAIICIAGPPACVVAATVAAAVFQAINNRGYICPNYMVVEVLFSPGTIRGCY